MEFVEAVDERRASRGLAELDRWLADQVRLGLGAAAAADAGPVEFIAGRLEAADLPKLAARVRLLTVLRRRGRIGELAEGYGLLRLLLREWGRRSDLPPPRRATVRCHLGLEVERAPSSVADHWHVACADHHASIWLVGTRTGRWARLSDTGAVRTQAGALDTGQVVAAELAFHDEAVPLCARPAGPVTLEAPQPALWGGASGISTQQTGTQQTSAAPPGSTLAEAQSSYAAALADDPWLEHWPIVIEGCAVVAVAPDTAGPGAAGADAAGPDCEGSGWAVADRGGRAVPLVPRSTQTRASAPWRLAALGAGGPSSVFGLLGSSGFTPLTVWSGGRAARL